MSNEIKEILDKLQDENNYWLDCCWKITSLTYEEAHLLLDYITNLQQENDYYFKKNNELSTLNTSLRSERDNYKSRIEKAIEYIELWHYRNDYRVNSFTTGCKNDLLNILQGVGKDE